MRCKTCKFYHEFETEDEWYETGDVLITVRQCRRCQPHPKYKWPEIEEDDWCGEYKEKIEYPIEVPWDFSNATVPEWIDLPQEPDWMVCPYDERDCDCVYHTKEREKK